MAGAAMKPHCVARLQTWRECLAIFANKCSLLGGSLRFGTVQPTARATGQSRFARCLAWAMTTLQDRSYLSPIAISAAIISGTRGFLV